MANRTDKSAKQVHGTDPQFLVEKITRLKILDCMYWKEHCFGLTAETLIERAVDLRSFGGCYANRRKAHPFVCLLLKMLQIQPDKEIVIEYIKQSEYRYLRLLGAVYLRMVGKAVEVYRYLEPLYNDYRKLRKRVDGPELYSVVHMDDCVDQLLREDSFCELTLPRITNRRVLEETDVLPARRSALEAELEAMLAAKTAMDDDATG